MDIPTEHATYQQVKNLIKQFTGQANTLIIPRVFIDFTGDHLAALLLSQILYWSDRTENPDGWFYKTADEWGDELGMSAFQIKRASSILEKLGIETKLRKVNGAPRMHYRVVYPNFIDLFLKFLENQESEKSTESKIKKVENAFSRKSKNMDFQDSSKTINKEDQRLPEITFTSPPAAEKEQIGGDGETSRKEKRSGVSPPHVQYLAGKGVGAAKMFTSCDPGATIKLYDLMAKEGWGNGAIVENWKLNPPTPERVKQFEEQAHAKDQPQRNSREAPAVRPPRPGERGYTGRR